MLDTNATAENFSWTNPDLSLLGSGRRTVPEFPLDLLGDFWARWVGDRAASASAPPDYVATALLAAAGGALANVRWPLAGAGWSEPPVLWCALVGSPSAGKSPAIDPVVDLIRHLEDHLAEDFDDQLREYEALKLAAAIRKEAWEIDVKEATKKGDHIPPRPKDSFEPDIPERPRIRIGDVTSEKLGVLAASLPRGLLVIRDELAGWLGGFDRYSGKGSDRTFALEMYGGRPYTVDRKNDPAGLFIGNLSVGALGGTQPDRLKLMTEGADDGFAARMLWSWPDIEPRFNLSRQKLVNEEGHRAFSKIAGLAMGTDDDGRLEPKKLRLSKEGEDRLEEFAREMQARGANATGSLAGSLGKARGHVLRLSCVLEHLAWCATDTCEPELISQQSVLDAAALVEGYFAPMAEKVFGDASIPTEERSAMVLAKHLQTKEVTRFNARSLRRAIGGPLRDAKAMDSACKQLADAYLIQPAGVREGSLPGRAPKDYDVNPLICGGVNEHLA
ncbi:MAG: DUF3987 domain-containing protein [Pseudomonadota bacterium]